MDIKHTDDSVDKLVEIVNSLPEDLSKLSQAELIRHISRLAKDIEAVEKGLPKFRESNDDPLTIILLNIDRDAVEKWCVEYNCEVGYVNDITFPNLETKMLFVIKWS